MIGDVCICNSEWTPRTEALLVKCLLCIFGWDSSHEYLTESLSALMLTDDSLPDSELLDNFKFRASVARPTLPDTNILLAVLRTLRLLVIPNSNPIMSSRMSLQNLPVELCNSIIELLVASVGIFKAVRLRSVNSKSNGSLQDQEKYN